MKRSADATHIALVEPAGHGGLAHFTFGLANALTAQGFRVTVFTSVSYEMVDHPRSFSLCQVFNRLRTNPFQVWQALREIHPTIVHLHGATHPELYFPLLLMLRLLQSTVVYSAHDLQPRHRPWFPGWFLRLLLRIPDVVIAHSQHVASCLRREFRLPAERLAVVPHGEYLFLAEAPPSSHRSGAACSSSGAAEPRVLFFGYILPQKGLADLLEAFRIVTNVIPTARLCIAGQPAEDFALYQAQIESLTLQDHVELHLGYVPLEAMGQFFRAAQVVALPYRSASQSGVLFGAYAFGRPVVATRCGGLAEYVKPGRTGLLVPVADPQALARALIELLSDPKRCSRMGEEARVWSQREFSWNRIASLTIGSYARVNAQLQASGA